MEARAAGKRHSKHVAVGCSALESLCRENRVEIHQAVNCSENLFLSRGLIYVS